MHDFTYGNKYRLNQSCDYKKKQNNKYSNNNAIYNNNNINPSENYLHRYKTTYLKDSNNSQMNKIRGKSSEKNIPKRVNNVYGLFDDNDKQNFGNNNRNYNYSETRIILDANNRKPKTNGKWENMQNNNMQINKYERDEITKYMVGKNFNLNNKLKDFSKENQKNQYLDKANKYRLRNNSADPTKRGNWNNSYNTKGSNMRRDNYRNTMLLLNDGMKRGKIQTQKNQNINNNNNINNIFRVDFNNNSNINGKISNNDNNNNVNLFKKNTANPNNRKNKFLGSNNNNNINNNFMNYYTNNNNYNNAICLNNNNMNNNNFNTNNNIQNVMNNNINPYNNFYNNFNSNSNFNNNNYFKSANNFFSNNNFSNFNFNSNMQNINNNNFFPFMFNNNMNFMNNMLINGIRFNNFIQSNNIITHQRSNSFDGFSINKNFNLSNKNNLNVKLMLKNSDDCSKFNVIIRSPSAKGLENVGATCYMNATLQCLAHIEYLTKFLLSKYNNISPNKKLTYAYTEVLHNLWQNRNISYYEPTYFKNTISEINDLFAGVQANDSKDLVIFLMENLHNELNKPNIMSNKRKSFPNQYNYEITFQIFSDYFMQTYRSVISDLFYGMYNSMMACLSCGVITHNVQCFNILIFPLEEVRRFKNRSNNVVYIKECFEYYQKLDFMRGDNQIHCNNCNRMSDSCNLTTLIICPKILVINLNRGKGLQFSVKLNFGEYLDIQEFVYYKNDSPTKYELIGIVTHFGPSSMSGHFIAFCKSFVDHQWYKYNDAIVNPSSFSEASTTGVPYILFYSYK